MNRRILRDDGAQTRRGDVDREPARVWALAAEALETPLCILNSEGTLVAHNLAWRELHLQSGGSPGFVHEGSNYVDACERMGARPIVGSTENATFRSIVGEILGGRRGELFLELASHDGDGPRWLRVRAAPLRGVHGMLVLDHAPAAPREARDARSRDQDELLRRLAAEVPSVMYQVEMNEGVRRFRYVSPAVEDLFEVSAEAVYADADALWNQVLEMDRSRSFHALAAASPGDARELDFRVRTPSGIEKWIHSIARPHVDERGHTTWIGVLSDVTARRHAEQRLAESEETYRTLFETVAQGVVYQDLEGRITAANPSALRILGLSLDQLQGRTSIDPRWRAIREDGSDLPGHEHPAMVALRTGVPVHDVVMGICRPDESRVWILVNAMPLHHEGKLARVYASFEDITERVELAKELRRQATTDFTTGLANRRSFMERLQQEHERVRRHPQVASTVASLDLDHFKQINDTSGHSAGDAVLQHFAAVVKHEIRGADFFARTGGEEFSLLLPETTPEQALALADRLRRALEERPARHAGNELAVRVSIGLARVDPADATTDELLARADLALYEAKHAGRDCVRYRPR